MKDWTFYLPIPADLLDKASDRLTVSGRTIQAELLEALRRGIDCQRDDCPMVGQSSERSLRGM